MKTEYKYIKFELMEEKSKTQIWWCYNKSGGDLLGEVRWYPYWRQYVFTPVTTAVFSAGCLNDIADFIGQLMAERRQESGRKQGYVLHEKPI